MEKKIRFADLVPKSGRPQVHTIWTQPKKDPTLSRAIREGRVLTVFQEPGTTDYGVLGFKQAPHTSVLVFPRPLPHQPQARIIGIKYDLVEEPSMSNRVRAKDLTPRTRRAKAKPAELRFTVRVRRNLTAEEEVKVEAINREEAEQEALKLVRRKPLKADETQVREEIVRVE
jgi:hypothetical protein